MAPLEALISKKRTGIGGSLLTTSWNKETRHVDFIGFPTTTVDFINP